VGEQPPFGFTGPGDEGKPADNPFAGLFGPGESADLGAMLHRLGDLLSWRGGPVNWDVAKSVATQTMTSAGATADPPVTASDEAATGDALRLAELWLDAATDLPAGATSTAAWSRAGWLEQTTAVWGELTEPIAAKVVESMGAVVPPEAQAMAAPLAGMLGQVGGVLFGTQVGQALGSLATEVVSSTDVGLPLGPARVAALVPAGVAAFGAGLGVPLDEVRLYLALREAAHHRLYVHTPWLRAHVLDAVAAFARGITIDTDAIESAVRDIDPNDPAALQRLLGGDTSGLESGLFTPKPSPAQESALIRLETVLALVEGWVDDVVSVAAEGHLPGAVALRETVRRRRAAGGPAEQTFAALVGLELRPRRLREAAALWSALRDARGVAGRDALWSHPDLLPGAEDLDDPVAFVNRANDDIDIAGLLDDPESEPPAN
jgi:putative hydrolase